MHKRLKTPRKLTQPDERPTPIDPVTGFADARVTVRRAVIRAIAPRKGGPDVH
jgi:hypothetical protein